MCLYMYVYVFAGISELQKLGFKSDCLKMLCAIVTKLQERCPLKYSLLRALQAFDPAMMAEHAESVRTSFQTITKKLVAAKLRSAEQCDAAERQLGRLLREKEDILKSYDAKNQRLDEFFYTMLADKPEFLQLWEIIKLALIISHGQATVERSFSINDDILVTNMRAQTLCAMKTVYDALQSIKVHEFEVTDRMLQYCGQARSKYDLHLVDAKTTKKKEAEKRKGAVAEEAYIQAKKKLKTLEDEGNSCLKEADKKANNSLKKHDFKLLAQSVALREKGNTILEKDVSDQRKLVQELQSKLVQ